MSRRLRIGLIAGGVLAALLLAAVIILHVLLQPQRFTDMLRSSAAQAGLELQLSAPAQPSLFPRPGLVLHGLQLTPSGSSTPLLMAVSGRLELPWRTLLGGATAISRLRLDAPRLDLDALRDVLRRVSVQDEHAAGAALPRIDAGIQVRDGSLVSHDRLLAEHINLNTGRLAPGQPFTLDFSARSATGVPFHLNLETTPAAAGRAVTLNPLAIHGSLGSDSILSLGGKARWHGGADLELMLDGDFRHAAQAPYTLHLQVTPAGQASSMQVALKLDGPGTHADLQLPPLDLLGWWQRAAGSIDNTSQPVGAPPLSGQARVDTFDAGGVRIEGLSLDAGPDVPATSTSSHPPSP